MATNYSSLSETAWMARHLHLEDWPLMDSPWPTFWLCVSYVILAKIVGPGVMANRKPLQLKSSMMAYNAAQVLLSLYIVHESWASMGWLKMWPVLNACEPAMQGPKGYHGATVTYLYFLSKFLDWTDTFFFVVRKKQEHISVLQLFHHASMPLLTWSNSRFYPNYASVMMAQINGTVHVLMYFYYFLAALGPNFGWLRFWKRGLTLVQITQFIYGVTMLINTIIMYECDQVPIILASANLVVVGIFLILFMNFYRKEYTSSKMKSS